MSAATPRTDAGPRPGTASLPAVGGWPSHEGTVARPSPDGWWTADGHVHSTFSDGASTLREGVATAMAVGLRQVTLVDHVRAATTWVPDLVRAVDVLRDEVAASGGGLGIRCGLEAKVLDRSGRLDLPERLDGVDVVLVADHRFPGPDGPLDPALVARWLARGAVDARSVTEILVGALLEAIRRCPRPAVLAHPLSILPKLGLAEAAVPDEWLAALAARCRATDTALEVNEKWACPGVAVARLFHAEGVRLLAGSDAHHASAVGRWATVRDTLGAVLGQPDEAARTKAPERAAPSGREAARVV